jgi:hypothetical protein
LEVAWVPSTGCGAALSDLFDVPSLTASLFHLDPSPDSTLTTLNSLFSPTDPHPYETTVDAIDESTTVYRNVGMLIDLEIFPNTERVILKANSMFLPEKMDCSAYYERKAEIYRALLDNVLVDVRADVDGIEQTLRGGRTGKLVGVHYREFDAEHDWNVVAPQQNLLNSDGTKTDRGGGGGKAGTWREVAPLDAFLTDMRSMRERAGGAGTKFYVASNSGAAKRTLTDTFPAGTVFTLNDETDGLVKRSEPDAVALALIDFMVLARSDFVLHSFGSSFGEEAGEQREAGERAKRAQ